MNKKKTILLLTFIMLALMFTSCQDYLALGELNDIKNNKDKTESSTPVPDSKLQQIFENQKKPTGNPLNVGIIIQEPLIAGCEPTAAVMAINYMGDTILHTFFTDNYLEISDNYFVTGNVFFGPDPYEVYAGNPREGYFGCFAPALKKSIDNYLLTNMPTAESMNITGATLEQLKQCVDNNIPVIVWASVNMEGIDWENSISWRIAGQKEDFVWPKNEHTLVLKGYSRDGKTLYFNDPLEGDVSYSTSSFMRDYNELGNQALIVYKIPVEEIPESESSES